MALRDMVMRALIRVVRPCISICLYNTFLRHLRLADFVAFSPALNTAVIYMDKGLLAS